MSVSPSASHPGPYIRKSVIPEGVSVSEAARLLRVSRPALSNLLNGKAALSANMAVRLEKAFGAAQGELMEMQRAYEDSKSHDKGRRIVVQNYAPAFLQIKAGDIEAWAGKNDARETLPVLLRRLINTTVNNLLKVDFPAFEESQRPGWDGYTESGEATQWVPEGLSGWEFSCEASLKRKADGDYAARGKSIPEDERRDTVFIFVTPRNWPGKVKWQKEKNAKNEWKDVRAYDASDLEQWLEMSPAAQAWFAGRIGLEADGCFALKDYWRRWSSVSKLQMSPYIFESEVESHWAEIENWLKGGQSSPLIITAASKEEALAFLGAAGKIKPDFVSYFDRITVFESGGAVHRLRRSLSAAIPVTFSDAAEKAAAETGLERRIVVAEKRITKKNEGIHVGLPTWESFGKACHEMGLREEDAGILRRSSGGSPAIMRRQLSDSPILRRPAWENEPKNVQHMAPFVLAGRWVSSRKADKEILSYLAGEDYGVIEQRITELSAADDAPIWREGDYCGVASVLEAFYTVAPDVTHDHLERFFYIAEYILCEDDPALNLEKSKRWAAHIYNKIREHSPLIRKSVLDTLILLSLHGQEFFAAPLKFSVTGRVDNLVRRLLEGQTPRAWQSQQDDLPRYAEASPEVFLGIVEAELQKTEPAFACLFESAATGIMSRCDRTGMLWALELLAWDPSMLTRVILVLAELCKYEPDDNWANKPANSIRTTLLPWFSQTEATLEQLLGVIDKLCHAAPSVGWDFCLDQIDMEHSSTFGAHRPRWRGVNAGCSQSVSEADILKICGHCMNIVLDWPAHNADTLSDMARAFRLFSAENRKKTERLIRDWLSKKPPVDEVVKLRESVRRYNLTRWGKGGRTGDLDYVKESRVIYALLQPEDAFNRHRWLFEEQWIDFSDDQMGLEDLDYKQEDMRLKRARIAALREIYEQYGAKGLRRLCAAGKTSHLVGWLLGREIFGPETLLKFASGCARRMINNGAGPDRECLSGIFRQFEDEDNFMNFMERLVALNNFDQSPPEELVQVLTAAPCWDAVWNMAQAWGPEISRKYWETVDAGWEKFSAPAANRAVRELLKVNRPRTAFNAVRFGFKEIEPGTLMRLLNELRTQSEEPAGAAQIDPYYLVKALKILDSHAEIPRGDLARLEYSYAGLLGKVQGYDFPNFCAEAANSPMLFFQLIAILYRREDGKEDSKDLNLPPPSKADDSLFSAAYKVFEILSVIPGTEEDGNISVNKLRDWTAEVRSLAKKHDREYVTDSKLGEFFFKSNPGGENAPPCAAVCEVMQEIASDDMARSMYLAVRNSRGVYFRPDHGGPERELAKKYSDMAEPLLTAYPFVARIFRSVSESYEYQAEREDSEASAQKRIRL